ncbi:hypothetical protein L4D15_22220 [Enterovibrio norvegicus]|uniref:hypothetical protein n=1 Tax=Enterovibrio norvegicus TaxID=188144 RepID=UPI003D1136AC
MYSQKGMTTVLVTSMVMILSFIFSLFSYKNVFAQIKRSQNEVSLSQDRWIAEGILECGFTTLKKSETPEKASDDDFFPKGCTTALGGEIGASVEGDIITLTSGISNRGSHSLYKTVEILKSETSGAIQVGSHLHTHQSLNVQFPDPGKFTEEGWECVALTYRGGYSPVGSVTSSGLTESIHQGFDAKGKDCLADYWSRGELKKDVVSNPNLTPFADFFNVTDSRHNEVRDNKFDIVIQQSKSPAEGSFDYTSIKDCGASISNAISKGNESVWVEGNCEISKSDWSSIVKKSNTNSVMVLVHDGVLSMYPGSSKGKYQGLLFHYNIDYQYDKNDWKGSEADKSINTGGSSVFDESVRNFASFYLGGALNVNGGVILDAKQMSTSTNDYITQNSLMFSTLSITYNDKYFEKFGSDKLIVRWKEGSWRDF